MARFQHLGLIARHNWPADSGLTAGTNSLLIQLQIVNLPMLSREEITVLFVLYGNMTLKWTQPEIDCSVSHISP